MSFCNPIYLQSDTENISKRVEIFFWTEKQKNPDLNRNNQKVKVME